MNEIQNLYGDTVIVTQDTEACGDCLTCENVCEYGYSMMSTQQWTEKEVAEACDLLMEGPKYLKQIRSLERGMGK